MNTPITKKIILTPYILNEPNAHFYNYNFKNKGFSYKQFHLIFTTLRFCLKKSFLSKLIGRKKKYTLQNPTLYYKRAVRCLSVSQDFDQEFLCKTKRCMILGAGLKATRLWVKVTDIICSLEILIPCFVLLSRSKFEPGGKKNKSWSNYFSRK